MPSSERKRTTRQTGKTTALLSLTERLNRSGQYKALYVNVEAGQAKREDEQGVMRVLLNTIAQEAADNLNDPFPTRCAGEMIESGNTEGALYLLLSRWAGQSKQPLVLFIDEIDAYLIRKKTAVEQPVCRRGKVLTSRGEFI